MNIDFIKWMVGYAKGFDCKYNNVIIPGMGTFNIKENSEYFDKIIYPLLLQRAIEGINQESDKSGKHYTITMTHSYIAVFDWNKMEGCFMAYRVDYKCIDEAKEASLKYIYEQEEKC